MSAKGGKACRTHEASSTVRGRATADWARALKPLSRGFYARPVLHVARDVIGKLLVSRASGGQDPPLVGRIVEAEAYRGPEDRAAHSYGGRRTARTEVMFGPPGHAYVFLIYGLHCNFNIVTGSEGQPQAVLIRAVEPLLGHAAMAVRRNVRADEKVLTNGPGKLCQAFGITREHYGADLTAGPLFLAEGLLAEGFLAERAGKVVRSARIGIDYAGPWAKKPWRFSEHGNLYVSVPRGSIR